MKTKLNKKDYINLFILASFFVVFIVLIIGNKYVLGSTTDWSSQHIDFPEYFRALFYDTKDLLPDFAFNLGAGQNIYNFAYYGLLSPIVLVSYLFPNLRMVTYLMIANSVMVYFSVILMYKFLRNHKIDSRLSFISTLIFMCATPLIFHLHRHFMFINYMPFLILSLTGVDKYFYEHKSWLLIISIFLMIMTSYYFSVVGIVAIVIYGIYIYLKLNNKITLKKFIIDGIKFVIPIFIGVLLSCILILPTFLVILSSREATTVSISLKDILMPGINLDYILYRYYGIGLSVIVIFALVHSLFKKRKEIKFLGIILSSLLIFPIINYLFNATMYIDSKSLIPFLPLYIIVIALFLKDLFTKQVDIKKNVIISLIVILIGTFSLGKLNYILIIDTLWLLIALYIYYKKEKRIVLEIGIGLSVCLICLGFNKYDTLVTKEFLYGNEYNTQSNLINEITKKDKGIYRISNQITPLENANRTYNNLDYYKTTLYSSTYNVNYNKFYYDVLNNPIQSRNRVITSSAKNYPFLLLTGNKYLISKTKPYIGYEKIESNDNINVYKNENVLPIAYASSNIMSLKEFNDLGYPYNQEAILKNIIVDNNQVINFNSNVTKVDLPINKEDLEKLDIKKDGDVYVFNVSQKTSIKLDLEEPLHNTLLYIRFKLLEDNPCSVGDTEIKINGILNKLTCNPWKYHNKNFVFDYVIANEDIDSLKINLSKGTYKIKDIEFYTLKYDNINNINENIDEFKFQKDKTKGDVIEGDIEVKNDGYFVLSVPFDKGFNILVDGKETSYEAVNVDFLGFEIKKGKHHIKIEYNAPGKNIGIILSMLGLISLVAITLYENKKSTN